ncbi:hypothetical protein [Vreelandella venusta]|nr:hypothetical protein [Halomonas venusta]UQI40498.1 hypothetical protein M3L73_20175 [Halomonas venusta]
MPKRLCALPKNAEQGNLRQAVVGSALWTVRYGQYVWTVRYGQYVSDT